MIVAILGCPGYYVTDGGVIVSFWRGRVLVEDGHVLKDFDRKLRDGSLSGYRSVCMRRNGNRRRNYYVHELVLFAFRGPRPTADHEACHGNGIRHDNRLSNLRWGTYADNADDRRRHAMQRDGYVDFWRARREAAARVEEGCGEEEGPPEYAGAFDGLL